CFGDIDQDLEKPGVQADCKVSEVRLEFGKPRPAAAGAPYDCAKGGTVIAKGDGGTFTVTGACDEIMVVGNPNTIQIDTAKKVAVKGQDNTVRANAVDAFAGDNTTKRTIAKGISSPQPTLAGVTDSDVDENKEVVREVGRKPITERCPEEAEGHGG